MNNVMLHVHASCDRIAVPFFIMEMSAAFPQFTHIALHFTDMEDRGVIQMLNDSGIRSFYAPLSKAVLESLDPGVVVLHDVDGNAVEGKHPWGWLRKWLTLSWHYSAVKPTVPCDFHVFSSDTLRSRYDGLIRSGFIEKWMTLPVDVRETEGPWFHRGANQGNISAVREGLSSVLMSFVLGSPFIPSQVLPKEATKVPIWVRKPSLPRGVIVGCGSEQEWMLEWWWKNYSKYNTMPVLFMDMGLGEKGMTEKARKWCEGKGVLGSLKIQQSGWFQKPFALAQTIFEECVWTDVDCEIRGCLDPVFEFCKDGFAAAPDPYYRISKAKEPVNSGVIAFRFGSEVVSEWCETITKDGGKYHDDQHVLDTIRQKDPRRVALLPREFNWLRLDGDVNPSAVCIHWTGGRGKEIIKAKIEGRYLREHFIADLATTLGWKSGLEVGTWRGRTFLHLLKACPGLTMTTVDLWEPQPENRGPEKYTAREGERWDHAANEAHVRAEAARYGARAVIVKGNSRDVVPGLRGQFDFAFIDGDHGSESVTTDIMNAVSKIRLGGVLIGHDIDWPSVRVVVDRMFPAYMRGPDNLWYVKMDAGPMGCPVGAVGVEGPAGA